jgi:1-acyl-sn-glycerol-3-phosphate acyltransferase
MSMHVPSPSYRTLRRLCRPLLRAVYRLQVTGAERLPASGPLVVVANHESVLDPFVLGCALDRELRFLAKAELWRSRPVAWAMDGLGALRVERGSGDREALAEARRALEAGDAVAVFPQGVVRSSGPWHRGAAKLALSTGAPVVPVLLVGTARALSRRRLGFPRLRVVVGEPIVVAPERPTIAAARSLTERLRAAVEALAAAEAGRRGTPPARQD